MRSSDTYRCHLTWFCCVGQDYQLAQADLLGRKIFPLRIAYQKFLMSAEAPVFLAELFLQPGGVPAADHTRFLNSFEIDSEGVIEPFLNPLYEVHVDDG